MTPAALAVVRAAVEDAQRDHVEQPAALAARIIAELRDHGWTLAPLDQAEQQAA
ncbi:hypothetical protein [Streptomyces phaeochromogenes]|uniref:hypothetical protein n=1 Tax=Streptomyces phaeochromogenes TaxID=1923 RepID=UPI002DDB424B|nr:hypothetical protein [Streptomyces phaeochromogenes]WRZ29973.1 hypothetical protein OG931_20585 [Streptomyces phaeochromogenes]